MKKIRKLFGSANRPALPPPCGNERPQKGDETSVQDNPTGDRDGADGPRGGRTRLPVVVGGAGRGARLMLPTIASWNARSTTVTLVPVYADPVPGRAQAFTAEAKIQGVVARGIEAHVEDVIGVLGAPVVLHLDRPAAVADALAVAADKGRPVAGYQFARLATGELIGLQFVYLADEDTEKYRGAAFFNRLSGVTARSGARDIFGARGRPEHRAAEPVFRASFAQHFEETFTKLATGVEPNAAPLTATLDGHRAMTVLLKDGSTGWGNAVALAHALAKRPTSPITRGEDFLVAELGAEAVRLHVVRIRHIDRLVAVHGVPVLPDEAVALTDDEMRGRWERAAAEAIRRADRYTITATEPLATTD